MSSPRARANTLIRFRYIMAEVRPFRAVRYNPDKVGPLVDVVTPPYDIIDEALQNELYERSPHNFVRLDFGKTSEADTDSDNRYTRAAETYADWVEDTVLMRDPRPCFYVYHQTFEVDGAPVTRRGFLCTIRVCDYDERVILPHERTLKGPKKDRLDLMRATESQMSQLFMLYDDPQRAIDKAFEAFCEEQSIIDIETADGIRHQLWIVHDDETIAWVQERLAKEQLLIADGHHRYETALAYRNEVAADNPESPAAFALAYLANSEDPGLAVWPTHRAIHSVADLDQDAWLKKLSEYFVAIPIPADVAPDELPAMLQRAGADAPSFVLLTRDSEGEAQRLLLTLDIVSASEELDALDVVGPARLLDVTVLHDFILAKLTGVSLEAQAQKLNVRYPRSLDAAFAEAARDDVQAVFVMNPTPISRIRAVCNAGGFMPQKSTYFYPKVLSGLVINDLQEF